MSLGGGLPPSKPKPSYVPGGMKKDRLEKIIQFVTFLRVRRRSGKTKKRTTHTHVEDSHQVCLSTGKDGKTERFSDWTTDRQIIRPMKRDIPRAICGRL